MAQVPTTNLRRFAVALLIMVSAAALSGCQQKAASLDGADTLSTGSTGKVSYTETARLGAAYQADPSNPAKAIAYANALESIGQTDRQIAVLKKLYDSRAGDPKISAIYGKKLVSAGQGAEAIPILQTAAQAPGADWRLQSALGSAYDQNGQFKEARAQYQAALAQKPDEMSVLNNLGMSYMLEGDLKSAEETLRKASLSPKASTEPRIRQNLALAVGLQGRFDEAKQIASEDLPPDQVEANMAYLQTMLSKSNTWQQLAGGTQGQPAQ